MPGITGGNVRRERECDVVLIGNYPLNPLVAQEEGARSGMGRAELRLFGAFDLRDAAGQPVDLPGQKDRALLAYLALNPGTAHPRDKVARDKLAGLLWGDHGETQARD